MDLNLRNKSGLCPFQLITPTKLNPIESKMRVILPIQINDLPIKLVKKESFKQVDTPPPSKPSVSFKEEEPKTPKSLPQVTPITPVGVPTLNRMSTIKRQVLRMNSKAMHPDKMANIIQELIDTEHDYLDDLETLMEVFLQTFEQPWNYFQRRHGSNIWIY